MNAALAVALVATFTGTAPRFASGPCCSSDTTYALPDTIAVVVFAFGQQSPTWAANKDSLNLFLGNRLPKQLEARWLARWRSVIVEAAPVQVVSSAVASGSRFTMGAQVPAGRGCYAVARWRGGDSPCTGRVVFVK